MKYNLITIFNYKDEEKYNTMFKNWLYSALIVKIYTPEIDNIIIYSKQLSDSCKLFIKILNLDFIIVKDGKQSSLDLKHPKWIHNVGYKLYNLSLQTKPYIFVDADTIILSGMNDCIKAGQDKPFIGVDHQTIPKHTSKFSFKFINTGFLIVSEPSFINFERMLSIPIKYKVPGTDQQLIYNYCRTINYNYTHPLIHYGWNSCAGYKQIIDDKIYSYGIPEKHRIFILHYWDEFKPWIKNCDIYKQYKNNVRLLELLLNKLNILSTFNAVSIYIKSKFNPSLTVGCKDSNYLNDCKLLNIKGTTNLYKESKDYDIII